MNRSRSRGWRRIGASLGAATTLLVGGVAPASSAGEPDGPTCAARRSHLRGAAKEMHAPAPGAAAGVKGNCPGGFVASTDRTSYGGTITRYATLADAQAGINPISGPHPIPARTPAPPGLDTPNRDFALYVVNNAPFYDSDANLALTAWYYTTQANTNGFPLDDPSGDRYYSGWGNPNNTNVGFLQLYDDNGDRDVAISGSFDDFDGVYWRTFELSLTIENAVYADEFARLWNAPGVNSFAAVTRGTFHSFELNVSYGGLEGLVVAPGRIESGNEPTSVAGTLVAVFENTGGHANDDPSFDGFYRAELTFSLDSWVFAQSNDALNGDYITSLFATVDEVPPTAACRDIAVVLDETGAATIAPEDIDDGSADNCGEVALEAAPAAFTCSNLGPNPVTLTVTDIHGNQSTCTAMVTVVDETPPIAACHDITVLLDGGGHASITPEQIDDGSSDACGVLGLSVSPASFTCADLGANEVTLTVSDGSGNAASCTATVTVEDSEAPVAACRNVVLQLDANGEAILDPAAVDHGSSDNCGITRAVSPSFFDCNDVGPNEVTLTVTDAAGNSAACTATVDVQDNVPPVVLCRNITVMLDVFGVAEIVVADVDNGSKDACGLASLALSKTRFGCCDVGANTVRLVGVDNNGNASFCNAIVTVVNPNAPISVCELGDMNCDGCLSVSDIGPFVLAITHPAGYLAQFPDCEILRGDFNDDGHVTVSDIAQFVLALTAE